MSIRVKNVDMALNILPATVKISLSNVLNAEHAIRSGSFQHSARPQTEGAVTWHPAPPDPARPAPAHSVNQTTYHMLKKDIVIIRKGPA
jgi:hypothetical protein